MAITGGVTLSVIISPVVAAVTVGKIMLENTNYLRFCRSKVCVEGFLKTKHYIVKDKSIAFLFKDN